MKNMSKVVLLVSAAMCSFAFAASTSTTFNVTATVNSTAGISATNAAFGTIAAGAPFATATGTFTVSVNTTAQPSVSFTPASDSTTPYMTDASNNQLPYNLYYPAGGATNSYGAPAAACPAGGAGTALTYGLGNTYDILGSGVSTAQTFNICAQVRNVAANQPAGAYSDTVSLALNY